MNGLREGRNGAVDSAVIREEGAEAGGPPGARAATSGEEVKSSTLGYLKRWMGWDRSFWFHSPSGVAPDQPMGGVLWPKSGGHSIYQDNERGREFRRGLLEGRLTAEGTNTISECFDRMLKPLERKKTVGGDLLTKESYSEAGLLKPISSQKWV